MRAGGVVLPLREADLKVCSSGLPLLRRGDVERLPGLGEELCLTDAHQRELDDGPLAWDRLA